MAPKRSGEKNRILIVLAAVLLTLLCLCLAGCARRISVEVEAGQNLPDAEALTGDRGAFWDKYDEALLRTPGTYTLTIRSERATYRVELVVKDTTPPQVKTRDITALLDGPLPAASDFVTNAPDDEHWDIRFESAYYYPQPATYELTVVVTDMTGNTARCPVRLTLISRDTEPPVIGIDTDLDVIIGTGVAYRRGVVVSDNCFGEISLETDTKDVDLKTPGVYTVTYRATDVSGNTSTAVRQVYVYDYEVSEDMLMEKIDEVLADIVTPSMSRKAQLKAVYDYVYETISRYVPDSDKSSWQREAYKSLFLTQEGDCFSYFAAAKAFLTRLGIEHMDIQRSPGFGEETHYWLLVNISQPGEEARWYHYDCTHLRNEFNHSGFLLTDMQIDAYNKARPHFYEYDKSAYPRTPDTIITPTPELEEFYEQ